MKEKLIKMIIELLYENKGSCGVTRNGFYNLPKNIFEEAIDAYIQTGIDWLGEYDDLTYAIWNSDICYDSYSGNHTECYSDRQIELLECALGGNSFWDLHSMATDEEIDKIEKKIAHTKRVKEFINSYAHKRKQEFTETLKKKVRLRDGRCVKCKSLESLQVDHILPLIDGGTNELDNLQLLCVHCHIKKTSKESRKRKGRRL